jgi:hypothetical protein
MAILHQQSSTLNGIITFRGVESSDSDARYPEADSADSNNHNRLDERRSGLIAVGSVDGPQPCSGCLRRRQRRRIDVSGGCTVALSHPCIRTRGAACCAYRRRFAIRADCICRLCFGDVPARVQRTENQLLGDGGVGGGSDYHARTCQGEAASISPDRKRRSKGRCCRECLVRVPFSHRSYGSCGSRDLAHCMGRPGGSFGNYTTHCV